MQLIKRLQCLALAAIALAFAQTALAATFPGTTTDETCAPSSEYAYYTDGTTTYKFTTWKNLLKAVGWEVGVGQTGSRVGGISSTDKLVVQIYNIESRPDDLGCEQGGGTGADAGQRIEYYLTKHDYKVQYTTFQFENCYFLETPGYKPDTQTYDEPAALWGATTGDKPGIKFCFLNCRFGDPVKYNNEGRTRALYVFSAIDQYDEYAPDFDFIDCNIRKFDGTANSIRLFGGSTCGDLLVKDCTLDAYINAQVKNGNKNSSGTDPTMKVEGCTLSTRVNVVGWGIGTMNSGFASYDVGGFKDIYGNPMPMMFFKSNQPDGNKSDAIADSFELGKSLAADGSTSLDGKALMSCVYAGENIDSNYSFFEFTVPKRIVYDADGGTGKGPVSDEGYDYRDTGKLLTVAVPSGFSKDGFAVEKWIDGSGNTHMGGDTDKIEITGNVNANIILKAKYGNTLAQTGWYTITGIHAVDQDDAQADTLANVDKYIKTVRYPWYSGWNWMTNVIDRVWTDYSGPVKDGDYKEVSWGDCGGELMIDGKPYTNQLVVTISSMDGSLLPIRDNDCFPASIGDYNGAHYLMDETQFGYTEFRFKNCLLEYNPVSNFIPVGPRFKSGVALVVDGGVCSNLFYGIEGNGNIPFDYFICNARLAATCGTSGCWEGDAMVTNCSLEAGHYRNLGNGGSYTGGITDAFGDSNTEAIFVDNVIDDIAPGNRICQAQNFLYATYKPNYYLREDGKKPLTVDVKVEGVGIIATDTCDFTRTRADGTNVETVKFLAHGCEVRFHDPNDSVTTYYALKGDKPEGDHLWTRLEEKYKDSVKYRTSTAPSLEGTEWEGQTWVDESGVAFSKTRVIEGDIDYYVSGHAPEHKSPELVGTLKMSSFVKGHEPTTPSGLSWRVGENGTLHPLVVGSGESPSASDCEYYIFSNPNTTEGGIPATLENLKKLEATGKGTDYYIRGIVTDFSEEPEVPAGHEPLVSAPAKFTVVNPEHSVYYDFMFVDWIETTDCQYLDTLIDPAQNGVTNFGFELDFKDDCFVPSTGVSVNDAPIIGSSTLENYDWSGFFFKNWSQNSEFETYEFTEGQFRFCQMLQQWTASGYAFAFQQPLLTNDKRLQVSFRQLHYSISSSDDNTYGIDWDNLATFDEEKARKHFAGSVYLASAHISGPVEKPYDYKGVNHNMHFYGLRFYNGTELIYEGIPAIEKSTGHRGLLRINGNAGGEDAFFRYSETYTNGMDIVTNTAAKAEKYVANLGDKVKGPLGLNEFNAPLLDFETHLAQNCGCFEVSAPSDKVAVTLEKQIKDRLWDYAVEETPGAQFIGTKGMTNATFTVLYATKSLPEEQDWTNTVVNANLADPTTATLGNGSLQLFDDNNWSAKPPEGTDEFKVVVLTAVSKPVVRTVKVTRGITVTLDANGGKYEDEKETATLVAMPGEPMAELTDDQIPTKAGNTFIGYYDAKTGGTKYYNVDGTSAKNCDLADGATLYAHWIKEGFEVLPYLNFDGTHFIVTEYVPNESTWARAQMRVNGEFEPTLPEYPTHVMFGQYEQDDGRVRDWAVSLYGIPEMRLYGWITGKQSNPAIGKGWYIPGVITGENPTTVTLGNAGFWMEGVESNSKVINPPYTDGFPCTAPIAIGGANNALPSGHTDDKPGYGVPVRPFDAYTGGLDVFTLQIYESEGGDPEAAKQTLKHDFIPAKQTSDGVEGLYDLVGGKFYPLQTQKIFKLDANGGTQLTNWVYAISENSLPSVAVPTRPGYTFQGYYTALDGGDQIYKEDGKPKAGFSDMEDGQTIYAHWLVACPLELFIAAHAHTAGDDVYLAVQPSFATALTDDAFSTWLNEAKDGKAFKVCVSDDGETFDATPSEVILEDSGEHKYDADVAKGWVWMKVNISAVKGADKKYWKAMFVTPAPESAD